MKDDDKCLVWALASGAGIIVSGDKHLLGVSGYRRVEVHRPRACVERCLEGRKHEWWYPLGW